MVRIRLRRVGAKKQPSYRVVAADKESPRDGRFLEVLGFYNPRTEPSTIEFKEDRVYHWMSVGAQPSDAVRRLFDQVGLWDRFQRFKDGEDVEKLAVVGGHFRLRSALEVRPHLPIVDVGWRGRGRLDGHTET